VIVIDASILVPALADDGSDGRRCRARLAGEQLVAPGLIDLEVCSVVRKLALRGDLTSRRAGAAVRDLGILPLRRADHQPLLERIWQLRGNLTPCDSAYVALAEALSATLVTGDARLAAAPGVSCSIEQF
jgi:predicted nucleic acid-binding protein